MTPSSREAQSEPAVPAVSAETQNGPAGHAETIAKRADHGRRID